MLQLLLFHDTQVHCCKTESTIDIKQAGKVICKRQQCVKNLALLQAEAMLVVAVRQQWH